MAGRLTVALNVPNAVLIESLLKNAEEVIALNVTNMLTVAEVPPKVAVP